MITTRRARSPALESLRLNVIIGRARAQLSQTALAERAGISRPTVSRIERGVADDVGLDVVQRLADALEIDVAELLIPAGQERMDELDLRRRAAASDDEFVNAELLLDAIDEAAERPAQRYSRAGRPPLGR